MEHSGHRRGDTLRTLLVQSEESLAESKAIVERSKSRESAAVCREGHWIRGRLHDDDMATVDMLAWPIDADPDEPLEAFLAQYPTLYICLNGIAYVHMGGASHRLPPGVSASVPTGVEHFVEAVTVAVKLLRVRSKEQ